MADLILHLLLCSVCCLINCQLNFQVEYHFLIQYYLQIKRNFEEIKEFTDYEDYKKCALLIGILLEVDGYLTDPDERQAVASVAYYITTKGLYENVYDEERTGILDFEKPMEVVELFLARQSIMFDAENSLKYSLKISGCVKIPSGYSPFSSFKPEDEIYKKMQIYDAYIIDDRSHNPFVNSFLDVKILNLSRHIMQDISHKSGNEIHELLVEGYKIHRKFFEYLENRFENEKDFDFS